jgi:hypothetical protein
MIGHKKASKTCHYFFYLSNPFIRLIYYAILYHFNILRIFLGGIVQPSFGPGNMAELGNRLIYRTQFP